MREGIVLAFAALALGLGALGLAAPARLVRWIGAWERPGMPWLAGGLRLLLGVCLWQVAPDSSFPRALRVLAALVLVSGVTTPLLPRAQQLRFLAWWRSRPPLFLRAWSLLSLAIGAFMIGAVA